MLPLWRKELRVVLCPDKAIVVFLKNGLRRTVISQAVLPVAPGNLTDWRPAMAALERWLSENDFGRADVKIQLSSCFMRFAMVPFSDDVNSYAERLTVAGLLFESIYGETAKQWTLTLDNDEYGEPCWAAAMDSVFWDSLKQTIASSRLKMVSMRPYAASVFNAFGKQMQSDESLLVIVEHGQAMLIDIRNKKITGVRKVMLSIDPDGQEVISLLRREMLISGLNVEIAKVYLHMAGCKNLVISDNAGMRIIPLRYENKAAQSDAAYEMVYVEDAK